MTVRAAPGTGRLGRRFPPMLRGRPNNLALASGGLVLAAIIGVQLGRSAISEINPIHFQGALERPQAITPPPEPAPYDPYGQTYVWSMPPPPLVAECGYDCGAAQTREAMRLAMGTSAGRDAALPYWREATPATELQPWPPGAMPDAGRRLERYMTYPVNREEAERVAAQPAPATPDTQRAAASPARRSGRPRRLPSRSSRNNPRR